MYNVEAFNGVQVMRLKDAAQFVNEFSAEIKKMHGRCIDIGCGPGTVTRNIILPQLPVSTVLTGADISKPMLDFAEAKFCAEGRLSFIKLDIESENIPPEEISRYDHAISLNCLHWCSKIKTALNNINTILRPGGRALVTFIAHDDLYDSYLELHDDHRFAPYMEDVAKFIPHFQDCTNSQETLKKYLEEAGFEVLHCSRREKSAIYNNIKSLENFLVSVNPFLNRVPENLKEEFKNNLTKSVSSRYILFDKDDQSIEKYSIVDKYYVLNAYFMKPK